MTNSLETIGQLALELNGVKRLKGKARKILSQSCADWKRIHGYGYLEKDSDEYQKMLKYAGDEVKQMGLIEAQLENAKRRLASSISRNGHLVKDHSKEDSLSRTLLKLGLCPYCGGRLHHGQWTEADMREVESDPDLGRDFVFEDTCDPCWLKFYAFGDKELFKKLQGRDYTGI